MGPDPLTDPVDGFLLGQTRGGLGCPLHATGVAQPEGVVISQSWRAVMRKHSDLFRIHFRSVSTRQTAVEESEG